MLNVLQYCLGTAFYIVGLILAIITGWWVYIRISPFHRAVNKIPGPRSYLPIFGNLFEFSGGLDGNKTTNLTLYDIFSIIYYKDNLCVIKSGLSNNVL